MFSKQVGQRLQEVVELAQEEVRRGRQGSLMTMDLDAMEEVATAVGDEFARSLLRALLAGQAEEAEGCCRTCPLCHRSLRRIRAWCACGPWFSQGHSWFDASGGIITHGLSLQLSRF